MTPGAEWDGILRDGEAILWQGRPDPGFYIHPSRRNTFQSGVLITLVGLLFTVGMFVAGLFLMGALALFFVMFGAAMLAHGGLWPTYLRRHSVYTLTNQRAIVGLARPGKAPELKTFEITADGAYELIPGSLGSVVFDHEIAGVEINGVPQRYAVGFMRFEGAEEVWQKVRDLQGTFE